MRPRRPRRCSSRLLRSPWLAATWCSRAGARSPITSDVRFTRARHLRRRAFALLSERELTLSFPRAMVALLVLGVVGAGISYRSVLSLASSESPDALLVAVPFVALALLAFSLRDLGRHGN